MTQEVHRLAGKLILGKIQGVELNSTEEALLQEGTMSGVTLFKQNTSTLEQLIDLIDSIRNTAQQELIIAVDQEGGAVQRFDHVLSPLPSAMAIAAASSNQQFIEHIAQISGQQLRLLGVNCLFAPVLDVCLDSRNPIVCTRAFGDSPQVVASYASTFAKTILANGVIPIGKHFPGHGSTAQDSHLELACNKNNINSLKEKELIPFAECISTIPAMMTGHIWMSAFDSKPLPASLSYNVTTKLLREQLGFQGLIITDDLLMKGITKYYSLGEAAVMAVLAGADQIIVGGTEEEIKTVHNALMSAINSNEISQARVSRSIERIKKTYGQLSVAQHDYLKQKERIDIIQSSIKNYERDCIDISKSGICMLAGELPDLQQGDWLILAPQHERYALNLHSELIELIDPSKYKNFISRYYPLNPTTNEITTLLSEVRTKNCILLTFRGTIYSGQIELAKALIKSVPELLCISTDVPYDLAMIPQCKNKLTTLDPSDLAIKSLASLLVAQQRPTGHCPIAL